MKEFEAKKADEERLREEEAKKTGKPPAKAPPAKGKPAGKDDKPQLDVPKLPMPVISEFESVMGNKYVREREYSEIAMTLLEPPKEEEVDEAAIEGEGTEEVAAAKEVPTPPAPAAPAHAAPAS